MITRRNVIKKVAIAGGLLLFPFTQFRKIKLFLSNSPKTTLPAESGDLFAGFLILPENTTLPSFIVPPRYLTDAVNNHRNLPIGSSFWFQQYSYSSIQEMVNDIKVPMFCLKDLPDQLFFGHAYILADEIGNVQSEWISYDTFNSEISCTESVIALRAEPDYYRPYPIWQNPQVEPDYPGSVIEKISNPTRQGILMISSEERVYYWIENDVLYSMIIRLSLSTKTGVGRKPFDLLVNGGFADGLLDHLFVLSNSNS